MALPGIRHPECHRGAPQHRPRNRIPASLPIMLTGNMQKLYAYVRPPHRRPPVRLRRPGLASSTRAVVPDAAAPASAAANLGGVVGVPSTGPGPKPCQDQQQGSHDEGGDAVRRVMVGRSGLLSGEEAGERTLRFDPIDDGNDDQQHSDNCGKDPKRLVTFHGDSEQ